MTKPPTSSNSSISPGAKLPPSLFDTFRQYKQDTNRVACWLGNVAAALGCPSVLVGSTPAAASTPKVGGRLKGSARKASKQGPGAGGGAGVSAADNIELDPPIAPTALTTTQLIDIALFIAEYAAPPVKVPSQIVKWASRAIASRRKCAEWYQDGSDVAKAAAGLLDESNRTHEYFITVLQQIVFILQPRVVLSANKKPKPSSHPGETMRHPNVELLEGQFAALATEEVAADQEPEDEDDGDWDTLLAGAVERKAVAGGKGGKGKKTVPSSAMDFPDDIDAQTQRQRFVVSNEDRGEFLIALFSLLNEFDAVRAFIKSTWAEYVAGDLALEEAAMLTTAALDKMFVATKAIQDEYPTLLFHHHRFSAAIFHIIQPKNASGCMSLLFGSSDRTIDSHGSRQGRTAMDCAEYTMLGATQVLEMVYESLETQSLPRIDGTVLARAQSHGIPNDLLPRFVEQANLLIGLQSSFAALAGKNCFVNVPQYMLAGLGKPRPRTPGGPLPFPLSVLLLTQAHLDIHHAVSTSPASSPTPVFDDYCRLSRHHMLAIDQYVSHNLPKSSTLHDQHASEMFGYMTQQTAMWAVANRNTSEAKHMINIMARDPLLGGLLAIDTHRRASALGTNVVEKWTIVLFAAFVYRAIQLSDSPRGAEDAKEQWRWALMDDFLADVSQECVYRGSRPDSIQDACKRVEAIIKNDVKRVHFFTRPWESQGASLSARTNKSANKPWGAPSPAIALARPLMLRALGLRGPMEASALLDSSVAQHASVCGQQLPASAQDASQPRSTLSSPSSARPLLVAMRDEIDSGSASMFFPSNTINQLGFLRAQLPSFTPILTNNYLLLHAQSQKVLLHVRDRLSAGLSVRMPAKQGKKALGDIAAIEFWTLQLFRVLVAGDDSKKVAERDLVLEVLKEVKDIVNDMSS